MKSLNIFSDYIDKIKQKLSADPSYLGLSKDFEYIQNKDIPINLAKQNTEEFPCQDSIDFREAIADFVSCEAKDGSKQAYMNSKNSVLLLIGQSGCGKTVKLQTEFVNAIKNWNSSKHVPFFIDLSFETNIEAIFEELDKELETNLYKNLLGDKTSAKNLIFYLDGFNKANFANSKEREILISNFFSSFATNKHSSVKIIVTSTFDYFRDHENYESWFNLKDSGLQIGFEKLYILAANYLRLKTHWIKMVKVYFSLDKLGLSSEEIESKCMEAIQEFLGMSAEKKLKTANFWHMLFKIMFEDKDKGFRFRDFVDLIEQYLETLAKSILHPFIQQNYSKAKKIGEKLFEKNPDTDFYSSFKAFAHNVGAQIASLLHLKGIHALKTNDQDYQKLFKAIGQEEFQLILKCLPLKITNKSSCSTISFTDDTFRYHFLFRALHFEARTNYSKETPSPLLSCRLLTQNADFLYSFGVHILRNENYYKILTNYLKRQIIYSAKTKSLEQELASSNSISILAAANYSFLDQNFSNTSIKNACLTNTNFESADFSDADLSNSDLTNSNFYKAKFKGTNLSLVTVGHPDLVGHSKAINCSAFSPDGKILATCSKDSSIKIWDVDTMNLQTTLTNHTKSVYHVVFSPDGKHMASISEDKTVILWIVKTWKVEKTFSRTSTQKGQVAFHTDSQLLVCTDYTICNLWNIVTYDLVIQFASSNSLTKFHSVRFSYDQEFILTGTEQSILYWKISSDLKEYRRMNIHYTDVINMDTSKDMRFIYSIGGAKFVVFDMLKEKNVNEINPLILLIKICRNK